MKDFISFCIMRNVLICSVSDKDSCEWFEVGVLDYNKSTKNYLVEKLSHANRIMECDGNTAITGGTHDDGCA